ncbi:MAG: hypothetical protein K0U82_17290, partial [Planctomycetes bacterium]|nr:hypothetical protein [Planctomycetota bacterium]
MYPFKNNTMYFLLLIITGLLASHLNTNLCAAEADQNIVLLPESVQLDGKESRHGLSVQIVSDGKIAGPV